MFRQKGIFYLGLLLAYLVSFFNASMTCFMYEMNKEEITFNYCENIDKPELNCNGKCYLMKRLKSEQESNEKPKILDNRVVTQWIHTDIASLEMQWFVNESERYSNLVMGIENTIPNLLDRPPQV